MRRKRTVRHKHVWLDRLKGRTPFLGEEHLAKKDGTYPVYWRYTCVCGAQSGYVVDGEPVV